MSRKKKPEPDDPEQSVKFIELAVTGDLKLYENGRFENVVAEICIFFEKHPQRCS